MTSAWERLARCVGPVNGTALRASRPARTDDLPDESFIPIPTGASLAYTKGFEAGMRFVRSDRDQECPYTRDRERRAWNEGYEECLYQAMLARSASNGGESR